jgi:membrane-associated protease RseP (regulator of RpoE activity)
MSLEPTDSETVLKAVMRKPLRLALFFAALCSVSPVQAVPSTAPAAVPDEDIQEIVRLPPVVVEASSRTMIKMNFKYHVILARMKDFTFTEVAPAFGKAGIKVGDRILKIDGRVIDGMRPIRDFVALLKEKYAPLNAKKVSEVPLELEVQAADSDVVRSVEVIVKASTSLTFYNYGY